MHADMAGIQVITRPIRTANELWLPDYNTIVIKAGMRVVHQRVALAHGIAHAELGHEDDRPKHENQADRYAALHLIHPDELEAARKVSGDKRQLADELGIIVRLLDAYLRTG